MAVQVHVAFSALINGSAVFAGGPYHCAKGSTGKAVRECMNGMGTSPATLTAEAVSYTGEQSMAGTIDDIENLSDDKVFLFSGSEDSVVDQSVMFALQDYYEAYMPKANINVVFDFEAEHTWPSLDYGVDCLSLQSPYIGNCNYDGSGTVLNSLYSNLDDPVDYNIKNLFTFDQTKFFSGNISVDDIGFVYIPTGCQDRTSPCKLHIAIHGCNMGQQFIGTEYAEHNGYNQWAESNAVIIVYPNVKPDAELGNPDGCWDWWGYLGRDDYALKTGPQMSFIKSIIDEIMGANK